MKRGKRFFMLFGLVQLLLIALLVHNIGVIQLLLKIPAEAGTVGIPERLLLLLFSFGKAFRSGFSRQRIDPVNLCLIHGEFLLSWDFDA